MNMKQSLFLLSILFLVVSCSGDRSKGSVKNHQIKTTITGELSREIVFQGNNRHNYYDIAITDDYYAFMDYYSDTLLQVRNKEDFSLHQIELREKDTFVISSPHFTKYDFTCNKMKNGISVWDNDSHSLKRINLDATQAAPLVTVNSTSSFEFTPGDGCTNCCITPDKTYAVMFNPDRSQVFYSADKTGGLYKVPPYPVIKVPMIDDVRRRAFASDLVVNEEKGVIVAALRFIDSVNFYDLNGNMTDAISFADYYSIPVADITNKYMDAEHSKKCFIDICCSDQYVFCLFDGSTDFTGNSVIYVFDWDGKHKATLQADHNLRKIATEKSGKYLLALSPNEQGGRDVVRYNLKNKI